MDMIGGGGAGGPTGSNSNSGYAATYYPGTPNPGEAQRLSLAVGQESAIDLQMQPVRLARITGTRDHLRRQADGGRDGDADADDEGSARRSCRAARRAPTRTATSR